MDINTLRIFSFCGGGTKGYGSNRFMRKFLHQWGIPQADFWKYADVMCGTCTPAWFSQLANLIDTHYANESDKISSILTHLTA